MKKIVIVVSAVLLIIGCKPEAPKDYVTLTGTITNPNSDSLIVAQRTILKTIKVKSDGTFSDTLKVKEGNYVLFDGTEQASVYLKNGYDLNLEVNTSEFDETLAYTGNGSDENNYIAAVALLQETVLGDDSLFTLEKASFDEKIEGINSKFKNLLTEAKITDTAFVSGQEKQIDRLTNYIASTYKERRYLATVLGKGNASPKFTDYENFKGGTTSLDDLKGKYVYVDVWATWCAPCKREIPFLKEVEKAYHGKNIEFVSISIDEDKNHEAWKTMVSEKELGGVQLFADNNWKSDFIQEYKIKGIPRFLLIDPEGNIVSSDAPRPSSKDLIALFDELKI
ncbi:TlpA family protein disulfide reductase [Lutibacter sp. A80]|uniref:thioredoxin-like domain-containing protein n=1 Tax=Lutibacter sp. A80 TaxID=2918453 RepID=UPI001F061072|nr:thioredoxin-like domain-containing protein [Lutibacter sp. A80]UMB59468.1 TlpA family protein disulfide reductase [Lutibacter sp. A80]